MKYLPFAVVLVVLGLGTIIEGKWSDRWGRESSVKLQAFTERLKNVPTQVGDWVGVDDEINQEEFKASNCTGYVSRTYTNREGQQVNVYLVSGSARHVTIHTPDWCYVGAGFVLEDEPQQYSIVDVPDMPAAPEFLTTRFLKEETLATNRIRIFWGFSDNGEWIGPRMPKPTFAGRSAMYKIYVITRLDGSVPIDIEGNPSLDFLRSFLPAVNKVLFVEGDDNL
ncbi:MAG: exosortase-associated EpsI family protein [Planctomycetales bacterium]|nr:exosortase-associated EpsI family protein [Planctomycetales bacterium]MCA9171436.1 exosortase-associated EpsI family protein [Planctomycetales bacterium]